MSADANNYDLHNVECHSLLPSCNISLRPPRFAKRAITNISDILRRHLCLEQCRHRLLGKNHWIRKKNSVGLKKITRFDIFALKFAILLEMMYVFTAQKLLGPHHLQVCQNRSC